MDDSGKKGWLEDAIRDIVNGSIAGACGKVIEFPFDTVKVRLQTQSSSVFPTTWSCIKYTYQHEGIVRGFFQGIASPLVGASLENAMLFVSYNQCHKFLEKHTNVSSLGEVLISGGVAGSCASLVLTPVELVKCKLQVANLQSISTNVKHTKVLPTIKAIVSERGVTGLWQGQSGTFIRESLGGIAWFATYELMKQSLKDRHALDDPKRNENKIWELLVSGGSAGLAFNASIFPADTVKSIMQTEHISLTNAVKNIFTKFGIKGFYRGLGITLFRAVPANAAVFYIFETLSAL
ncbi:hypothetical protein N7582_002624 [Saccharomyces uvarum]|uniref:Ort1p n=1 Tax=Saccharomyces uvarum TaxID=230603 RepID=A0AA35NTZ0_SACUV|nr:hypothetical protein N7582_002624 [Saccharomyces uvarum]CAI4064229.1 hypothetical protein SUVC_08G1670 [Saccharomyces uvarum]